MAEAVPEIDFDDLSSRCPMSFMAQARKETPVVKITSDSPDKAGYLVTRAEDIIKVARDTKTFTSLDNPQSDRWAEHYSDEVDAIFHTRGWPLARVLVWVDPPEHGKFRKLVDRIFAPSQIAAREEHIRICIDKLLAEMPAAGTIDAVETFAAKLPAMVMTREFGAPEEDFQTLIDATNAVGQAVDFTRDDPATRDQVVADFARAVTYFQGYMMPRIEAVRAQPSNTMLSELANARDDNGEYAVTIQELHSILVVFLIAATHSTTGGVAWAIHALANRQDVQARLRAEPEKIPDFVEEVLRHHGTVQTSYRAATTDAEVAGVTIPTGANVLLRWDSANFDEKKWPDPEVFDIDRKNVRNHMAFGSGIHFCVGNPLARKEMQMGVAAMLQKYRAIVPAGEPTMLESFQVQAWSTLPLQVS